MMKIVFLGGTLLLLIYLLLPGTKNIDNFKPLPNSIKSNLSGDTIQVANISAYYSNNYRDFATKFYAGELRANGVMPFGPLRINYPPEFAFQYIKDQTQSTYLEEYTYPLRDSIFVNGLEPFEQNGKPRYWGATQFSQDGQNFDTKVTLRYYPSPIWARLVVWVGIVSSSYFLWKLGIGMIKNG